MQKLIWEENKNLEMKRGTIQYDLIKYDEFFMIKRIMGSIWLSHTNEWMYKTRYNEGYLDVTNLQDAKLKFPKIYKKQMIEEHEFMLRLLNDLEYNE